MTWVTAALASTILFAIVTVLDKRLTTNLYPSAGAFNVGFGVMQASISLIYFAFVIPLVGFDGGSGVPWAMASGVLWGLGLALFFHALRLEEMSRAVPVQQMAPVFAAIVAVLFLGDVLTPRTVGCGPGGGLRRGAGFGEAGAGAVPHRARTGVLPATGRELLTGDGVRGERAGDAGDERVGDPGGPLRDDEHRHVPAGGAPRDGASVHPRFAGPVHPLDAGAGGGDPCAAGRAGVHHRAGPRTGVVGERVCRRRVRCSRSCSAWR